MNGSRPGAAATTVSSPHSSWQRCLEANGPTLDDQKQAPAIRTTGEPARHQGDPMAHYRYGLQRLRVRFVELAQHVGLEAVAGQ